jgi:hypothetical protein
VTNDLRYCICGSRIISIVNGKRICKSCGKEKMPIRDSIIKPKLILPLLLLIVSSCVPNTHDPDWVRIERDVRVACDIWLDTKAGATIIGLFVPGVASATLALSSFVDPVCVGTRKVDATTVAWIMEQVGKLHAVMGE